MNKYVLSAVAIALLAGPSWAGSDGTLEDKLRALAGADGSYQVAQSFPYTGTKPCAPSPHGPGGGAPIPAMPNAKAG